ncbi:MAG TPA: xanthine dehydrogenase family protein subunit M, partial [Syntrophorhabdales bacterium]|nr:xanthine dehydrogenase family protein subunit M [Syntrophorhabdales bacterium]
DFTYLQPGSVKEALAMLAEHKDECKIICGGQSLLIVMRQGLVQVEYLIDIKGLNELSYIKYDDKGGLKIGATTTHRAIEKSDVIAKKYPVLTDMEEKLASIQVRNWGTIGGNLAHADSAGDPAPVLTALGATVKVGSAKGERTIPLEEFYTDLFETAMEPGEIILEVQVPAPAAKSATAYKKFNLLESDQGIVAVAVSITLDGDTCKDARVVLGNAAPTSVRAKKAESVLVGKKLTDALFEKAGEAASEECEPVGDIHASEEYRRHLVGVLTKRMAKAAFEQAKKS